MIDDLADAGLLILGFSGGEPLIRRDIFQLTSHAAARDLVVNIATNGAVVNERIAQRMKDSGVRSVTVSLDGADAATHEYFRQFPGLYERSIRAIRVLVSSGLRVVVSFTPTKINYLEGPDVVRLAYDLGASGVNMSEYVPAGRGSRDLCLSPETLHAVVKQWIEMRGEYEGRMHVIWHDCRVATLVPPEQRDLYSGCGAGKLTARICVDGTLTPCVFLPNPAGNLKTTPFREIWEHSPLLQAIRGRQQLHDGNCAGCALKESCGGCRATSMSYYGDPFRGDPSCWILPERPID
jgi:radical SAM protein with 4Fe4S-binding SPASM domain